MLDFLAVGDVMLDVFAGAAPAEAVHAAVRVRGGGSALNAAVWAASEGAQAAVIGRVGSDSAATMSGDHEIPRCAPRDTAGHSTHFSLPVSPVVLLVPSES